MALTRGGVRAILRDAPIYKMSLGKSARYRAEALENAVLVFQSEITFYDAVIRGDDEAIAAAGKAIRHENYPGGGAPPNAYGIWRRSIETFRGLPPRSIILHWEADLDHLHWAISGPEFSVIRSEKSDFGQLGYIFHRTLEHGWKRTSVGGVPLSNIHPSARNLAINQATLNRVQTDGDYFRALILDQGTDLWEARPSWREEARKANWHPKPRQRLLVERRGRELTPLVVETADHFFDEARRMAATAAQTAAYANGQTVLTTVKVKDIGFTREELQEEILDLFKAQNYRCALTDYDFKRPSRNPHLRPSLDRKNSSLGYVPGNLQIVTRAANFFKSASDDADWLLKADALERMAVAIQQRRKGS